MNWNREKRHGVSVKTVVGTTFAAPLLLAVMPVAAQAQQSTAQLQQQIDQLQMRVNQMEQQQQKQQQQSSSSSQMGGNPLGDGFKVGDTTFKMSGYIKLDAVYNFDQNASPSTGATSVTFAGKNGNRFGMTAKQSRLIFSTDTKTPMGDVKGHVEMDFYGGGSGGYDGSFAHGYTPRVRQAYFTWNHWLIGKAWTTFSDFNYGTTLDFYGPEAQIFRRHAQIRYTFDLQNNSTLDVALETPFDQNLDSTKNGGAQDAVKAPDFVARYKGHAGNLDYQFAGLARWLRGSRYSDNSSVNTFGYGLDAGATYKLPTTGTTLMASVNYGKGDGAYVYDPAGGADAFVNGNGSLKAIRRYGYILSVSQELTPKVTTNVVWGQGFSQSYGASTTGEHKRNSSLFVNVMYKVLKPLTVGAEYGHLSYTRRGAGYGTQNTNRLELSAIYDF